MKNKNIVQVRYIKPNGYISLRFDNLTTGNIYEAYCDEDGDLVIIEDDALEQTYLLPNEYEVVTSLISEEISKYSWGKDDEYNKRKYILIGG
jgi:hypothetical protein